MSRYEFEGATPEIAADAFVSRDATLVGDVRVESGANVWPGTVLRGDVDPVVVGEDTHVGDNSTVHATEIGDNAMIASGAVLDDSSVDDGCLVGFNATVSDVSVGERSVVAAGAICRFGTEVPPDSFVYGHPAQIRPLEKTGVDAEELMQQYSTGEYRDLAERHTDLFE
ncbi:MAG: gamma carbonic anhydrase family protein [Natronomonas sp.]